MGEATCGLAPRDKKVRLDKDILVSTVSMDWHQEAAATECESKRYQSFSYRLNNAAESHHNDTLYYQTNTDQTNSLSGKTLTKFIMEDSTWSDHLQNKTGSQYEAASTKQKESKRE